MRLRPDRLSLTFHGQVSDMTSGDGAERRSLMPTWLELLRAQHGLGLLWYTVPGGRRHGRPTLVEGIPMIRFVVSAILALTVAALTSAPLRAAQAAGVPQRPPQAPAPTANPEPEPAKPAHTPPPTHEPSPSPTPQPAATSSPTTEKEFKQLVVMIRASLSGIL